MKKYKMKKETPAGDVSPNRLSPDGDPSLAMYQLRNCRGCRFANVAKVGTGEPCCTFPGQAESNGVYCLTRQKSISSSLPPGFVMLDTGSRVTVEFEDQGQDFLEWDIINGEVVDCRPYQGWAWKGSQVLNLATGPGDRLMIIPPKGDRMILKEPVARVKTHAR